MELNNEVWQKMVFYRKISSDLIRFQGKLTINVPANTLKCLNKIVNWKNSYKTMIKNSLRRLFLKL